MTRLESMIRRILRWVYRPLALHARKLPRILRPGGPLFSAWNWTRARLSRASAAAERIPPCSACAFTLRSHPTNVWDNIDHVPQEGRLDRESARRQAATGDDSRRGAHAAGVSRVRGFKVSSASITLPGRRGQPVRQRAKAQLGPAHPKNLVGRSHALPILPRAHESHRRHQLP